MQKLYQLKMKNNFYNTENLYNHMPLFIDELRLVVQDNYNVLSGKRSQEQVAEECDRFSKFLNKLRPIDTITKKRYGLYC